MACVEAHKDDKTIGAGIRSNFPLIATDDALLSVQRELKIDEEEMHSQKSDQPVSMRNQSIDGGPSADRSTRASALDNGTWKNIPPPDQATADWRTRRLSGGKDILLSHGRALPARHLHRPKTKHIFQNKSEQLKRAQMRI